MEYLESDDDDKILQNISKTLDDSKICATKDTFHLLLHLLFQIGDKHPHTNNFFNKISKILQSIKSDINKYFSSDELLTIFGKNKRLVLILLDEQIITVNEEISHKLDTNYFVFEKKAFISEAEYKNINIYYVEVKESIFESNSYLNSIDIISYAAAYGSLHIFQYMAKKMGLTSEVWKYAIYGGNKEIIDFLENQEISKPKDLISSAMSTHNNKFIDYLLKKDEIEINTLINYAISSYNFQYIDKLNEHFVSLCEYDYKPFYKSLIESKSANINDKNSNGVFLLNF